MTAQGFAEELGPWAAWVSPQVGFHPSVILAQWSIETGYGTSVAWIEGHNPAGISAGGTVNSFESVLAGMEAYVETARLPYYDPVRSAGGAIPQAYALGESPWAAARYGDPPGADLVMLMEAEDLFRYDGQPVDQPPAAGQKEAPYMIPSGCTDLGAVKAQIRDWWNCYRSDSMTVADQNLCALAFATPAAKGGFGGDPDLLLAHIVDTAGAHLRPQWVGAV